MNYVRRKYLLLSMKGVLFVIDDSKNTQSPEMEKRTYTVDEIAKQLNISKRLHMLW